MTAVVKLPWPHVCNWMHERCPRKAKESDQLAVAAEQFWTSPDVYVIWANSRLCHYVILVNNIWAIDPYNPDVIAHGQYGFGTFVGDARA